MFDFVEIIKNTTVGLLIVSVFAYFIKLYIEKRVDFLSNRVADIGKMSLDLKKGLRDEERKEFLSFRVAVEKWEYLLQTFLFDFTMLPPDKAEIEPFYKKDKKQFLEVKIAVVRVSIYLRDKNLELQLMDAINRIRQTYYPLINESMPKLIDLQAALMPLRYKLQEFEKSGMKDLSFAPTKEDRDEHLRIQTLMTEEMQKFSASLLENYQSIAEQMVELKEAVNQYIYRPVKHTDVDKD